jgi:flagellar motor switch protein FliM
MADGEKLLTDEEMQAIEEVVASGGLDGEGYNVGIEATTFDIAAKDNKPDFDSSVLDQINERFHRQLRVGLARELKYGAEVALGTVEVMQYKDYLNGLAMPISLNLTNMSPLKGESICVIDPQVVFSCVDNWFGGAPRSLEAVSENRNFSATEEVVLKKLRIVVYSALLEAWAPALRVQCEFVRAEPNPLLANIAADTDLVVVNRFRVGNSSEVEGAMDVIGVIDIVHPYESIKLVRSSLTKISGPKHTESRLEKEWSKRLASSLDEVLFEAVVNAGELPMSLAKLNGLKVGDVISLQDMGRSELCVNGLPIYEVQIGSRGDNAAVKIVASTMAGATNE